MISKMALSIFLGIGFEFGILISSQPLCALNPERLTAVSEKCWTKCHPHMQLLFQSDKTCTEHHRRTKEGLHSYRVLCNEIFYTLLLKNAVLCLRNDALKSANNRDK